MSDPRAAPIPIPRRLAYSLVTTIVVLGGCEVAARLCGFGQRLVTVPDDRVGFRLVPNQDRTTTRGQRMIINSHGMRDEEFPKEKPAGEYRVLLLGDSLTFGIDVEQEEIFSRRLHAALASRGGGKVRVMNGAVQGYDTSNERDWLNTFGFGLSPDLVVVMFYPNDIEFQARKLSQHEFPGRDWLRRTAIFEWMERTHIERESRRLGETGEAASLEQRQRKALLDKYRGATAIDPNDPEDKKGTIVARGILFEMAAECKRRNVRFAVAMIPGFANTRDPKLPNIMGGLGWDLDQAGIPKLNLLDALVPFHPQCWLDWDEGHLSPLGHEKVAAALEAWWTAPNSSLVPVGSGG